jgi:hypothetical protein
MDGTNYTGAELDQVNPITRAVDTWPAKVDKGVFRYLDTVDRDLGGGGVEPYKPTTPMGEMGQAALTTATAGALDPAAGAGGAARAWSAFKNLVAGGAADAAHQLWKDSALAPIVAAIFAHNTTSAAGTSGRAALSSGYENMVRPIVSPKAAGQDAAGRVLSGADMSGPGLADPTAADLGQAQGSVAAETGALGQGTPAGVAMTDMRSGLQNRLDTIKANADAVSSPLYDQYRAQLPMTPADVRKAGLPQLPAFGPAVHSAAVDMRNGANGAGAPVVPYTDFNPAFDPVTRPGALTPDVLDRAARKMADQATNARNAESDSGKASGLTAASTTLNDVLNSRYPIRAQAQQAYADAMQPAAPFREAPVASALDRPPPSYGYQPDYKMMPETLFDRVAASKSPDTVVQNFIDAAGGDKQAILGPVQDALVDRLRQRGVIDPLTGEVDAKALARETAPYMPTIKAYLPDLAKRFGNATAAQKTLDNMRAQADIATDVAQGGLRDSEAGVITGKSFSGWLKKNETAINQTQGSAVVGRLKSMSAAIGGDPGAAADAFLTEALPAAVLDKTIGTEGGILGLMGIGKAAGRLVGPRLDQFRDAYSQAIEDAVKDPKVANDLVVAASRRPGPLPKNIRAALGRQAISSLYSAGISDAAATQQ